MTTPDTVAEQAQPQFITDEKAAEAALTAWATILAYSGAKLQHAVRVLGEMVADSLGYHEHSLNRKAVSTRLSGISSTHKSSVKAQLLASLKDTGQVPNPLWKCPDGTVFSDLVALRIKKAVKSLCHAYLKDTNTERVPLGRLDASGNPIPPTLIDLSKVEGMSDEWNTRFDNAYKTHTPALKVGAKASKKDVKATLAMPAAPAE